MAEPTLTELAKCYLQIELANAKARLDTLLILEKDSAVACERMLERSQKLNISVEKILDAALQGQWHKL